MIKPYLKKVGETTEPEERYVQAGRAKASFAYCMYSD